LINRQPWPPRKILLKMSNQMRVKRLLSKRIRSTGGEVRYRENIPLAVMGVISLAVLFVFGVSEMEMRATPRQHDRCGGSHLAAISPAWLLRSFEPTDLSPPAFRLLPTSPLSGPTGCTRSSTTALIVHREARPSACSRAEATTGPITIPESQRRPPNYGPSLSPGEAAVSGADGIAVFEALHRWRAVSDAFLRAFDLLELNGKDIRLLPLGEQD
jgi:hypothetical protein